MSTPRTSVRTAELHPTDSAGAAPLPFHHLLVAGFSAYKLLTVRGFQNSLNLERSKFREEQANLWRHSIPGASLTYAHAVLRPVRRD